ncbi:ABC transporter ATP-binding protein [Mycolicibacterium baixiangningiae]|uniref:ABC transporter ATP-binding protein n=1 Tax=Mycolicibacterium baixiangningiae TaxID=2761578 RepID=UPI0018D18689|nr:ABC transporter ATP-binding protein [Mycolicibacterium baixiangningiae]
MHTAHSQATSTALPVVSISELNKSYFTRRGDVEALRSIEISIHPGEFVSFVGPSGCGKSTLLKIIAGLEDYQSGKVEVFGDPPKPGRRDVGIMLQSPVLLPWRTVLSNVVLPVEIMRGDLRAAKERAREIIDLVGLSKFTDKYGWELSGGMQQRVSLARLLLLDPDIMLLDEPFSALDEFNREKLTLELSSLHTRFQRTAVYVTHSIAEAVLLSDRVVVLKPHPGEVLEVVAIDLPRPRTAETLQSVEAFELVRRIRAMLFSHDEGIAQ